MEEWQAMLRETGRHPLCTVQDCQDDCLERAECERPAWDGHGYCGMCPTHNRPRHACACYKGQVN